MLADIVANTANVIIGIGVGYLWKLYLNDKKRRAEESLRMDMEMKALKNGVQSLLRANLIEGYNHYVKEKGWIPIYAKEGLLACADAYHALGANGVMDDIVQAIRDLPNHGGQCETVK